MVAKPIQTICLIDDDDVVRDAMRSLLEAREYGVVEFVSADDFLGQWDGKSGRCLILDIHMPGMSGLDLLKVLRDRGDWVPTILVTGQRDMVEADLPVKLGAVALLDKPVPPPVLFAAIRAALAKPEVMR